MHYKTLSKFHFLSITPNSSVFRYLMKDLRIGPLGRSQILKEYTITNTSTPYFLHISSMFSPFFHHISTICSPYYHHISSIYHSYFLHAYILHILVHIFLFNRQSKLFILHTNFIASFPLSSVSVKKLLRVI